EISGGTRTAPTADAPASQEKTYGHSHASTVESERARRGIRLTVHARSLQGSSRTPTQSSRYLYLLKLRRAGQVCMKIRSFFINETSFMSRTPGSGEEQDTGRTTIVTTAARRRQPGIELPGCRARGRAVDSIPMGEQEAGAPAAG